MHTNMMLADASIRDAAAGIAAGLLALVLRKRYPILERNLWIMVLGGMLLMPALQSFLPHPHIPVPGLNTPQAAYTAPLRLAPAPVGSVVIPGVGTARITVGGQPADLPFWSLGSAAVACYLVIVAIFLFRLIWGLRMTRAALASAKPVTGEPGIRSEMSTGAELEAAVLESAQVNTPLTAGLVNTVICLPTAWRQWSAAKLRLVLAHERSHVRHRDNWVLFAAAINRSIFWFHPLAWWLERRLAALAEEIADDAAAGNAQSAPEYARVLVEICQERMGGPGRLVWQGAAMGASRNFENRVQRILRGGGVRELRRSAAPVLSFLTGVVLIFLAAVQLQPRALAQNQIIHVGSKIPDSVYTFGHFQLLESRPADINAEEAVRLEAALAADPENESSRRKLTEYYLRNGKAQQHAELVLWMIDHHPEAAFHIFVTSSLQRDGSSNYEAGLAKWRAQLAARPNDTAVIANAARELYSSNFAEALALLKRGMELQPDRFELMLATAYAHALQTRALPKSSLQTSITQPLVVAIVDNDLNNSSNAKLLREVAKQLAPMVRIAERNPRAADLALLGKQSAQLLDRARALDPAGEPVKAVPQTFAVVPDLSVPADTTLTVTSKEPGYPELALKAKVQGKLRFRVAAGADGLPQNIQLVSGHPLLVQAGMELLRKQTFSKQQATVDVVYLLESK